ncbi:MAG: hypothetical protein ACI9KE_002336 [Polyangiales bacterium]|jgi:hypothetical protein
MIIRSLWIACLLSACATDLTQVVISVDVAVGVPCDIDSISIRLENSGVVETLDADAMTSGLPATITVLTDGTDVTDIVVSGELGGVEVYRASSRVTLREGETLHLPVVLTDECFGGGCEIDGSSLAVFTEVPAARGTRECVACTPSDPPVEVCNGRDDDCNGMTDEDVCADLVERYDVVDVTGAEPFVDACTIPGDARGVILMGANESEAMAPEAVIAALADFSFSFYGEPVSNLWVGDNGYVTFGDAAPNATEPIQPGNLEGTGVPLGALIPFWERLETRDSGVCVTLSDATDRVVITWKDACFSPCGSADRLTFSVVLEGGSDRILFLYDEMIGGDSARANGSNASGGLTSNTPVASRNCVASMCGSDGICESGANMGMPCGFNPLFSNDGSSAVPSTEFSPVTSD